MLLYEPEFKVLICKQHQYEVRSVYGHLRDEHKTICPQKRRAITERYARYELEEPGRIQLPRAEELPIPALGQPVKALRCNEEGCGHISINRKAIMKHCNQAHDWRHSTSNPEHWAVVHAQTFFTSGGLRRYFTVHVAEPEPEPEPERESEPAPNNNNSQQGEEISQEGLDKITDAMIMKREWADAQEKHRQELEMADKKAEKTDRTGWFTRTGWPEHLAGRNLQHLAHASRLPDRDEWELRQACKIVDRVIEQSVAGLASLGHETRRWLRSVKREEIDVRPLARLQNPESQARYAGYMKRFVCYCLRIATATAEAATRQTRLRNPNPDSDYIIRDSDEDWEEEEEEEQEQAKEKEKEKENNDDANEESDPLHDARELFLWHGYQRQLAQELWQLLNMDEEDSKEEERETIQIKKMLELFRTFVFQVVGDEPFRSPLVHFLAVLAIDEQMGRLRNAENYSFMLAGIVYCVRVIAAELMLPSSQRKEQNDEDRENFLHMRQKYLADGSYSPMSTMISLLAYSKHITLNKTNAGSVQWSAD
jgi:hypothetical protein